MTPAIEALSRSRTSAPVSSSGPAGAPAAPAADPMAAINDKLDQILALLTQDATDDAKENSAQ